MTLGSDNISPRSLAIDHKVGWIVTLVGIPSAFILHGYVGFIFGSLKANPWWNSPLMPVVFIFSAMVSGIAAVLLLYMLTTWMRKLPIDMPCVDTIAMYLFYIFILDFSLEMLDLVHRVYEADESFRTLNFMVHTRLYFSQIVLQICIGTLVPIFLLAIVQVTKLPAMVRRRIYVVSGCLVQIGVFAMRWNVVIGGQLFSKSFLGYTTYKMGLVTKEGLLVAIFLTILPLVHSVGADEAAASLAGERDRARWNPQPERSTARPSFSSHCIEFGIYTKFSPPPQPHLIPRSAVRFSIERCQDARAGLWLERNQSSCVCSMRFPKENHAN